MNESKRREVIADQSEILKGIALTLRSGFFNEESIASALDIVATAIGRVDVIGVRVIEKMLKKHGISSREAKAITTSCLRTVGKQKRIDNAHKSPVTAIKPIYWWSRMVLNKTKMHGLIQVCGYQITPQTKHGVYFLTHKGRIVYVGQSKNCFLRVAQHFMDKTKQFDDAMHLPVSQDKLLIIESAFIVAIKPPLNKLIPTYGIERIGLTIGKVIVYALAFKYSDLLVAPNLQPMGGWEG